MNTSDIFPYSIFIAIFILVMVTITKSPTLEILELLDSQNLQLCTKNSGNVAQPLSPSIVPSLGQGAN